MTTNGDYEHEALAMGNRETSPTNPTQFTSELGTSVDTNTHEGLRLALGVIVSRGWDSPAGGAVLAALDRRSEPWARATAERRGLPRGCFLAGDVLSISWKIVDRFAENIAAAQAPWAYLWAAVGNALAIDAAAQAVLSSQAPRRRGHELPSTVLRVGLEARLLDRTVGRDAGMLNDVDNDSMSPGVAALVDTLSVTDSDKRFWADAVGRALEVMADSRRSYEEYRLRRDPYLREQLGLTVDELGALGALLIGPRRGDRAAQSLLLALHRDPSTTASDVVGAERRIALLRARPHQRCRAARSIAA